MSADMSRSDLEKALQRSNECVRYLLEGIVMSAYRLAAPARIGELVLNIPNANGLHARFENAPDNPGVTIVFGTGTGEGEGSSIITMNVKTPIGNLPSLPLPESAEDRAVRLEKEARFARELRDNPESGLIGGIHHTQR